MPTPKIHHEPTAPRARGGDEDALEAALRELPRPVLVMSTAVGRGMVSLGEALVERMPPDAEVHHRTVEEFLPRRALDEDVRRYRWISSRLRPLLHVVYRLPLIYQRKLWRERRLATTDLTALAAEVQRLGVRSVVCVSHRPAFWTALAKERHGLDVQLAGVLGEYGNNLGWRYMPWSSLDAFWTPVPPAELRFARPDHVRDVAIELPARRAYQQLRDSPGARDRVLVVCGLWGQGRIDRVVRALLAVRDDLRIDAVCGDNPALQRRVDAEFGASPNVTSHGVVESLAPLMAECASVVTKPGIATTVEAHAAGRKIFLLRGMPVAEDNNARFALRHFGAEWFRPECFARWLAAGRSVKQQLRFLRRHPRYFAHLAAKKAQFAQRFRWARLHGASDRPRPEPLVYKLMLNWKCNLRCPMCMLWGDTGWVKEETAETAGTELDWAVVEKIFQSGLPWNSSFILSGGEPTMYEHFGRLLRLLQEHRKYAIICTNGLWLDRFLEELNGNPYPTLLISLDGLEDVNESLRGKGVYRKIIENLDKLQALRRPPFIGIQFTVMPENVGQMERFCEAMVARGVDWILLNPGWFLSQSQARAYEAFMQERFAIVLTTHLGYVREYDYDKDAFCQALKNIWSRDWPIQIASHIKEPEWVHDFIDRPDKILGNRLCYKQWLRLDVLPDGKVPPCVQFPDLTVGDLTTQSVAEVWHSEANRSFQKLVHGESLPICAKCDNIYLYNGEGKGDPAFRAS